MGSEIIVLLILPIIFFGVLNFIFQETVSAIADDYYDNITCQYPDYTLGINATSITCSYIDHPTPYEDESTFSIPTGWITFLGDTLASFFYRIGLVFALLTLWITFPIAVEDLFFMIYITVPLAIMLGFGVYKGVSPFV